MRLFVDAALAAGAELALPPGAARHAQVRRVQPGDELLLFDGAGSDWPARVLAVGRSEVRVQVGAPCVVDKELPLIVTLALVMPANERMDTLVEQATQLGVARVQPLLSERSVLRLAGERAERKREHWQGVAQAACEQCGRARVPAIEPIRALAHWLRHLPPTQALNSTSTRLLLSLAPGAPALPQVVFSGGAVCSLSGPEGGLTADEEAAAVAAGFAPTALGPRVLRAETAPLAVLAWLAMQHMAAPR